MRTMIYWDSITRIANLVTNLKIIKRTLGRNSLIELKDVRNGCQMSFIREASGSTAFAQVHRGAPIPFPPASVRSNEFRRCLKTDDGFIPFYVQLVATRQFINDVSITINNTHLSHIFWFICNWFLIQIHSNFIVPPGIFCHLLSRQTSRLYQVYLYIFWNIVHVLFCQQRSC